MLWRPLFLERLLVKVPPNNGLFYTINDGELKVNARSYTYIRTHNVVDNSDKKTTHKNIDTNKLLYSKNISSLKFLFLITYIVRNHISQIFFIMKQWRKFVAPVEFFTWYWILCVRWFSWRVFIVILNKAFSINFYMKQTLKILFGMIMKIP